MKGCVYRGTIVLPAGPVMRLQLLKQDLLMTEMLDKLLCEYDLVYEQMARLTASTSSILHLSIS